MSRDSGLLKAVGAKKDRARIVCLPMAILISSRFVISDLSLASIAPAEEDAWSSANAARPGCILRPNSADAANKGDDGRCSHRPYSPAPKASLCREGPSSPAPQDEFVAELVPLHFNSSAPRLDTMFFRRVQQLHKFGVRYAAEFSGKARVISRPGTRVQRGGFFLPPRLATQLFSPISPPPEFAGARHPDLRRGHRLRPLLRRLVALLPHPGEDPLRQILCHAPCGAGRPRGGVSCARIV